MSTWMHKQGSATDARVGDGRPWERVSRACGWGVAAVGAASLLAWVLQRPDWLLIGAGRVPTMPATAIALVVAGAALAGTARAPFDARWLVATRLAAAFVGLVGALTLASYLVGRDLGLDRLVLAVGGYAPDVGTGGRPALVTGVGLLIAALALMLRGRGRVTVASRCGCAIAVAALGYLVMLAEVFGAPGFFAFLGPTYVAMLTAFAFVLLGVGAMHAAPACPLTVIFFSPGPGGMAARRLLPFALLGPLAVGGLRVAGDRAGYLPPEVGVAFASFVFSLGGIALATWGARSLDLAWRHEAEADEARRRQATLLDHLPMLVALKDPEGRYLFVNQEFERATGVPRAAVLGRTVQALGNPDAQRRTEAFDAQVRATGRPVVYEDVIEGPDGPRTFWVMRFPLPTGPAAGIGMISQDVTVRVRALQEAEAGRAQVARLQEVQRMKDHLLSTFSHELKTPLAMIMGFAELLGDELPGDPRVEGLEDGVRRLDAHIGRMLDLTALVGGAMPAACGPVDVEELFSVVAARGEASAHEAGMRLETYVQPGTAAVRADFRRLGQLLQELVDNAVHHAREGRVVCLEASPAGPGEVALAVCDEGAGIAADALAAAWTPFGQAELDDSKRAGGLGIGLALVRYLAELQGARVEVAPGGDSASGIEGHPRHRGCCVRVLLPAVVAAGEAAAGACG